MNTLPKLLFVAFITLLIVFSCQKDEIQDTEITFTKVYEPAGDLLEDFEIAAIEVNGKRTGQQLQTFYGSSFDNWTEAGTPGYQHKQKMLNITKTDTIKLIDSSFINTGTIDYYNIEGKICRPYFVTVEYSNGTIESGYAFAEDKGHHYGYKPTVQNELKLSNANNFESITRLPKFNMEYDYNCGSNRREYLYMLQSMQMIFIKGNHPTSCNSNFYWMKHNKFVYQ